MLRIAAITPLLLLAACDAEVKSSVDKDEAVQVKADADGRVAFNLPFAKGEVKLPQGMMSNADFDIDGVKMYPGAAIGGFNVDAKDGRALVDISFTAPAAPDAVRGYFLEQFAAKGVEARLAGDGIEGTSKDGDPFTMTFAPDGSGTKGSVRIDAKSDRQS